MMKTLYRPSLWLIVLGVLWGCTGKISGVHVGDGGAGPIALRAPTRRLRRLSSREYNNVVRDLLGNGTRPADRFVLDAYQNGYDNGSAGLAVQSDQVVGYQDAAEAIAADAVTSHLDRLLGGCDVASQGGSACADAFVATFAPRAYRRPLSATEGQRLRAVYDAEAQAAGTFARGLQTMLEVVLQSPQFLYREELGPLDAAQVSGAEVRLTPYEVAAELSFLLTGSIPDEVLWTAVGQGQFNTMKDYQREAARLLGSPGAKDTFRAFLHQWLATDRLATLSKDAAFYPSFNPMMAASMAGELDRFYDQVLWTGQGSLGELFTSNQSFVDPTLANLYGVSVPGAGFAPVTLDPLRAGVLGRAGYLAVHSATDSSGPIARGVFLLDAILCAPPPPPPPNVPPAVPAGNPTVKNLTTRQRFDQHVSSDFCASCHRSIDGVGFGFEQFDGIGVYRTVENGQPVDSTGTLIGTGEIDGDYNGVAELARRIAASRHLADCYERQAYRYAMGEIEPGGEDLRPLSPGFSTEAKITDVMINLLSNPLFVTRTFESAGP